MKSLTIAALTGLTGLLIATAPANAKPVAVGNSYTPSVNRAVQINPADLVSLANRGYFEAQGIPSHGLLAARYELGTVTAKDIVRAAVAANRLPQKAIADAGYLNSVTAQLDAVYVIR